MSKLDTPIVLVIIACMTILGVAAGAKIQQYYLNENCIMYHADLSVRDARKICYNILRG
jgi:hypothetical protein